MPNTLEIETSEKQKPVLLLYGENPLIDIYIKSFREEFKIALITANDLNRDESSAVYKISPESSYLLKELQERIDYSLFFFNSQNDMRVLKQILPALTRDKTKTLIFIPIRQADDLINDISFILKIENLRVALIGDLFGAQIPISFSEVSELIHSASSKKVATMTGDDLRQIFPISDVDALGATKHILFGTEKNVRLFSVFYQHPQTIISAIHLIKRHEPDLSMEFKDTQDEAKGFKSIDEIETVFRENGIPKPLFIDHYLKGFEKSILLQDGIDYGKTPETTYEKSRGPKRKLFRLSCLLPFLAAIILYFLIQVASVVIAQFFVSQAITSIEKNNLSQAFNNINSAEFFLSNIHPLDKLTQALFPDITSLPLPRKVILADEASTLLRNYSELASTITHNPFILDSQTLKKIISEGTYMYLAVEKLYYEEKLSYLGKIINSKNSQLLSILPTLPSVLGYGQEKNYLILFQNNGELRPTGGFIGSVGELSFKNGSVKSFSIKDVYDLDGQLKTYIEPPFIVRRYLQPHLYLRDSNFNLNFQTSASMSALLYKLEGGKQVDGVVAIDFEVLRKIIQAVGPIELPAYNKTLDDTNAFDFLQTTINSNFFPGSIEKRKVLTAIFDAITLKLENDHAAQIKVAALFSDMMVQKHILFAFNLKSIQNIFSANGFGGDLTDLRKRDDNTIYDTFGINEANIGVNKANININRSAEYDVSFKKEEVDSTATINIYNTGQKSITYKAYLRVIAPKNAKLQTITIDGIQQKIIAAVTDPKIYESKNFKIPDGLEVLTQQNQNTASFGFPITVNKESNQIINVSYILATAKTNQSLLPYSLIFIKQPGTDEYDFKLKATVPEGYTVKEADNATLEKGTVNISQKMAHDQEFLIKFVKR